MLLKSAKCKNNPSPPISNLSWCDLNIMGNLLNPKCKCQKQSTFTPNQFETEGAGYKHNMKKKFIGTEKK